MQFRLLRNLLAFVFFILGNEVTYSQYSTLESSYHTVLGKFKQGLHSPEDFKKLYDDLSTIYSQLEYSTKKYGESPNLKQLAIKVESVRDFIGEISPDGRNFDLTIQKFNLAMSELDLQYENYLMNIFCMPSIKIYLWNNRYEALLILNTSECMYRYKSTIVYNYKAQTKTAEITEANGAVDYYSYRCLESKFIDNKYPLILEKLDCYKTEHCNWRNR